MAVAEEGEDVFKEHFKRFKKVSSIDKCNGVIDFSRVDELPNEVERVSITHSDVLRDSTILGLVPPSEWEVYRLKSKPGFLFVRNPFMSGFQHQWVVKCVTTYPLLPNVCNLDSHMKREGLGGVWPPTNDTSSLVDIKSSPLYKLRWVTLGYHYNWTSKCYDSAHHSPFPSDLACLSKHVLSVLGYIQFEAEAAIVNYYHMDSTLSGHTDHSERDLDAPLISISFGQSAIFLIGGKTKQEVPAALLLNSGDIVIMGGVSRLGYHAVPRVLHSSSQDGLPSCLSMETFRKALKQRKDHMNVCSLCGKNLSDLHYHGSIDTYRRKRHSHTTNDDLHHIRKAMAFSSHETYNETDRILSDSKTIERENSPAEQCCECKWIIDNWEHFKVYLNTTRINVNIRQVGLIDD